MNLLSFSAVLLPSVSPFSDSYQSPLPVVCTDGIGVVCEGVLCFVGKSGGGAVPVVCSERRADEVRVFCTLGSTDFADSEFFKFWSTASEN